MSSNNEADEINANSEQRTLFSGISRKLIELGYGKNGKIIEYETLKKFKNYKNEDLIFNLTLRRWEKFR